MDSEYYERLAPPGTPAPWLAVLAPGRKNYIIQIASSEQAIDIGRLKQKWIIWIRGGDEIVVVKDDPSFRVHYCGGLYCVGYLQAGPVHLAARRNWFLRYKHILDPHLANPLPTLVQFYERRPLEDLLCTMRSTRAGPFPFSEQVDWPRCGHCGEPMAFIGTMDFRGYRRVGGLVHMPEGSLVLHGCDRCTIPCRDDESTSLTWITSEMPLGLRAGTDQNEDAIEVGRAYETIEFSTPAMYAEDLSDDADFSKEWGIHQNFACPLNKVGGHLRRIQSDDTPRDGNGNPMQFVGQFLGSRDVELGDSGTVYVFFSDETRETKAVLQCY
jgi:hypothetical protein